MREFNFNVPVVGLKQNETAIKGHLALNNLRVGDGYFSVPKAYTLPWELSAQLLRGKDVTLLWKEGAVEEEELPEDAIGIYTIEQLQYIGHHVGYPLDGYYMLANDIDASDTVNWNDGAGFEPIGSLSSPFVGTLNGNGFTVDGLFINAEDDVDAGLFGAVGSGAQIFNLGLTNIEITGGAAVGKVTYTGGLAGINSGTITNCYVTGVLTGNTYPTGGLVGINHGTITNCYATGAVTNEGYAGGLVGENPGLIEYCYATGAVTGTGAGGLVGASNGTVTSSYYDSETSGQSDDEGKGTPKTTAQMKTQSTFVNWDFADVWGIDATINGGYPYLLWEYPFQTSDDGFYTVNETTLALTGLYNVAKVGVWQMADYGPYAILSDGTTTLLYNDGVVTPTTTRLGAVCARDARLVYGDVGSYPNAVGWSAIDGADIPDILAGTALSGVQATRNTTGIAEMPWRGKVLAILPMGDTYIIYGEDGIAALREIQGGLGFVEVSYPAHLGLYARGAVAGNDQQHVFRGTDGGLWMINPKLDAVKLDYAWTLDTHDRIVYEPVENLFWISDDTESYCLSTGGLAGPIDQVPSSLALIGDEIVGTGTAYTAPDEGDPQTVTAFVHTNTFDMGMNGQKRVTVVNLHGEFSHATVGCLYKYSSSDTYREKVAVLCSPEGAAFLNIALVYGQLKITATMEPEARITKVELRYQAHDRRFIRGTRGFVGSENENGNA